MSNLEKPLIVLGAGGLGREVVRSVQHKNTMSAYRILGVAADDIPDPAAFESLSVAMLGNINEVLHESKFQQAHFIVAIGHPMSRAHIHRRLVDTGLQLATVIHPFTSVSECAQIGHGTFIAMGTLLSQFVRIGDSAKIDQGCSISHDVEVGNFASLAPAVTVCGAAQIGERANIGAGAILLPGIKIGADATVGAGAVVTKDVARGTTVAGVPARLLGSGT